jgi:hypothetical protein
MRVAIPYSFSQDINGNFVCKILVSDSSIEADYAWVYFSLSAPLLIMTTIYINGMFNNYLTRNSKWIIIQKRLYEKLF